MPKTEMNQVRRERAIAFVVIRLSSSRLPAKQLKTIGDRPLLNWIIDNLRRCNELDEIVITTVAETANEPLRAFAQQEGLPCFWYEGEVDHVTTRLRQAAEEHRADICLLISGDCPLVYGPAVDHLIDEMRSRPEADTLGVLPDEQGQPSALEGVQVARLKAWQLADDLADRPELKEHQFPVISIRSELFNGHLCRLPRQLYAAPHRFSVDTWADLEFMNSLHDELTERELPFELPTALALMQEKPALSKINSHVHQRGLIDTGRKALFVIDAGGAFGLGHLMRSLELARQLTERKGWAVVFAVDDEDAAALLRQQGKRVAWSAFGRKANPSPEDSDQKIEDMLGDYDLLVLDIYDQRGPASGWRRELGASLPTVVIDNRKSWAAEADLVITPGVTAENETPLHGHSPDGTPHLSGAGCVILRREIRQAASGDKDLDLLVYLHSQAEREAVAEFVARHNLNAEVVSSFTPELPRLMARARLYISGFGISFYEALALGTLPVCRPDSEAHRLDALRFFQRLGMKPQIITEDDDLEARLLTLLKEPAEAVPILQDGTPALVAALAELVESGPRALKERLESTEAMKTPAALRS